MQDEPSGARAPVASPRELLAEAQALVRFGIWDWELANDQLTWSDELSRIFGITPGEPTTFDTLLARVHPDDQANLRSYLVRARKDGTTHAIEYRIVRPDGTTRTLQGYARASLDDRGTPIRVVGTDQDITESKELVARVVFSDRMVSIGTLAGGVAHEINNPLAVISANLEMLVENHENDLTREAMLAVERIRAIVRGLMTFSRTDTDQRSTHDLHHILELAIAMTSNEIRHRARLVKHYGSPPAVQGNEARLGHVFINLLVNAAEAIPDGYADRNEIQITTRADAAGWAVIEIRDSGAGIPPPVQSRIFDPFFTTKAVGRGTGLGLSICHGIVRSLGGEIGFRSELGKGTIFSVTLPPAANDVSQRGVMEVAPLETARRGTVLIVDDEVMFANSLRRLFANEHDVSVVNSGRDALDRLLAGQRFDVILCDLMMPEISGVDLHAELQRLDPDQADRVIFLTGGAFSTSSQQFLESIANVWFEKPCDLQELRAAVRQGVARSSGGS